MNPDPRPLPDRYAVLGYPVAHSQSPFIHAEFARQTGQNIAYGRIESPLDGFEASVRGFIASADPAANGLEPATCTSAGLGPATCPSAGLGPARGCNITVPFKFQVLPLARRASDRAVLAQAANVLRFDADGWFADNTDGTGLVRDIQQHAGRPLPGQRVLLIGAGGAAAGVLGPLIESHARFPQRVNAGFMQVVGRQAIRLRVYERGSGETLACGTGACAAAVAGIRRGLLDSPVCVTTRGGDLTIAWSGLGQPVMMTGPAVTVFTGEIEL